MADIETSIGIGLDTSNALVAIKNLQREISAFHTALAKGSSTAAAAAANLQKDLINNLNATGQFSASMTKITSSTESFTTSLERNKFSMGEYFRYAGASTKTFGKNFAREFDTIEKVARERVKDLQTQYIKLGRDANGALQAIKVRPLLLDMDDLGTKTQIAAQKQQIFNQLLNQGSTNLLNFGKNTQWAGRQLMVGFTIPLSIFATTAAKTFMELEKQAIKFKRVYGELFTTTEETDAMVKSLQELSLEFTKYGVAVEKTMGLAADAAAMGKTGVDLLAQVTEANRLAVLGNVEQAQALETTISVTNAFGIAATDLAKKIDFLNAVENQTVTSIEDLTIAIPKAAPVIKQLGGDVEDLAYFLTAMKEGGINASEGANALKSGLASMINPTAKASEFLMGFGINLQNIVNANKGDVKGLVTDFASALDTLDPLNRAQAIEQLFGKFQFSRLSTLFQNVIAEGTQAERVLALTNATVSDLAALSNKELGSVADSTTFRFQKAIEDLRAAIAPVGEQFLKAVTPIIEFAAEILNKFNSLNEGVKNFVVIGGALIAGLGPVFLMTFGLIANGVANIIKGFAAVRGLFLKTKDSSSVLGEQFDYMTQAQLDAAAVASSLERAHEKLEQRFTSEKIAVQNLLAAYEKAISAKSRFSTVPGVTPQNAGMKLASGIVSVPGPKGAGDIVPAVLSPGEAVIPAKAAQKYAPIIQGMIAGNLPGFEDGVFLGMPRSGKSTQKNRDAAEQIYQEFLKSSYANVAPTEYGHQLAQTSGHSFPIFGLGGVYAGPNGNRVFVKPVMDERSALAEMRATQIARQAHGLKAPEQRIVVMRDPQDVKRQRRFLALESALDSTFVNEDPMAVFNESQYFKQLVASLLRVDKDLSASNVFGDVVADVGPAGVFSRASGVRDYTTELPSMEQQALINLLGIKGGAKRAFAESTLGLMAGLTPQQYHQRMIAEIQAVLPALKQTVAGFGLTDPREADVYAAMIQRLEQGLTVDWSKFHTIHSAVKPKQSAAIPGYEDGVISVPGPKGAGDIQPAMLSPGEAVVPAKMAKKYAPLISAMISGNIPGYSQGKRGKFTPRQSDVGFGQDDAYSATASHFAIFSRSGGLAKTIQELSGSLEGVVARVVLIGDRLEDGTFSIERVVQDLSEVDTTSIVDGKESFKDIAVAGKTYRGTTILESKARNAAYEAKTGDSGQKVSEGAAFTLQEVEEIGARAAKALAFNADINEDVANELRHMVEEGRRATELLRSSNSTQEQLDFMYDNTLEALSQSYQANTGVADKAEADAMATEALTKVKQEMAQLEKEGLSDEETLQRAKEKLIKTLLQSNALEGEQIELIAGRAGTAGGIIADTATGRRRSGQFSPENVDLARVKTGRSTKQVAASEFNALFDAGEELTSSAIQAITAGARSRLRIQSPSKETFAVGEQAGEGLVNGAMSTVGDAQQAGSLIGATVSDTVAASVQASGPKVYKLPGLRRVTTDINVYQREMEAFASRQQDVFDKIKAQHAMLGNSFKNYFGVIASGPTFDINTRQEVPSDSETGGTPRVSNFEKLNSIAMQTSFAFSSLASVTTMFGAEMGAVNEAMFGMSNALFALTAVTQLLTLAKESELFTTLKGNTAKLMGDLKNVFSGGLISGFKNIGGAIAPFATGLRTALSGLIKFIPIIGVAATAFAVFKIIGDIQEQQKQKIEGMGNAAFAAGEKLKGLAGYAGFTPTRDPGSRYNESKAAAGTGITQGEASTAVAIGQTEEFKADVAEGGKFYQDVQNLKNASVAEAQVALQALFVELLALAPEGTDPAAIKATIAAIAEAADKGDVSLEIPVKLDPFKSGNEKAVADYVNSVQETVPELDIRGNLVYNKDEVLAGANAFGSAATAGLEQLNTQFGAGLLDVKQYNDSVKEITDSIAALEPIAASTAATKVFENYGVPPEVYGGITNLQSQLVLIKALAAGVAIDPEIYAALDAADDADATPQEKAAGKTAEIKLNNLLTKTLRDQAKAVKDKANEEREAQAVQDLTAIQDQIDALEDNKRLLPEVTELLGSEAQAYKFLADEKWKNLLLDAQEKDKGTGDTANVDALVASYKKLNGVQAEVDFGTALADLREDAALKKELEANGYSAAEATAILGDEMLQQARIQAAANGTLEQFNKDLEEYIELSGKETTGGGTPDKTPMQQAVEQLQDQRKEILNTNTAYAKLRQAGISAGKAFKIAQDPILAAALAAEKVGTKKWKELVALINKVNASNLTAELRTLTNDIRNEAAAAKNVKQIEKFLSKIGYSADQIDRVISGIEDNPDLLQKFANDMKDGKVNAQSIRDYLASIKNIKVELTIEDMEAQVDKAFSDIQAGFAAQREVINLDFEMGTNDSKKNINPLTGLPFNTNEINKQIKAAEQYISERQYAIDDYEYQLSGIEEKETAINESYDKRIEALDKVQSLNEKISQGQQDQLSVANALASGDIAAAAEAAQQMQANQAAKALEDQKAAIEAARAAELAGVRSANGLSRIEIEQKIKDLKTEIVKKEEEVLEPQSRALELAEDYRDAANDSVTYLDKNESAWKKIEAGVRLAKVEAEGYKKAITDALALVPQLNSGYASAGATNAVDKSKLDSINQKIANAERYKSNMQAQGRWAEFAGATAKLDQYYAERKKILGLAAGGSVAGPGTATSDSIPALLSNGEFVVRASSVDKLGTGFLDYINKNGSLPGFAAGGAINFRDMMAAAKAKDNKVVQQTIAKKIVTAQTTAAKNKKDETPKPKPGDAAFYKPRTTSEAIGMGMQMVMDNITRGLFGQAGANAKNGVSSSAGDIVDSIATTTLNALPIPAIQGVTSTAKFGNAVKNSLNKDYVLKKTEMRDTLPAFPGIPPMKVTPYPVTKDVTALSPSLYYSMLKHKRSGLPTLGDDSLKNLPLRGFENYSTKVQNFMGNMLGSNLPYRMKRKVENGISSFVSKVASPGIRSIPETLRLRHRSTQPLLEDFVTHPSAVPVASGRAFGPGTYFAKDPKTSRKLFASFGNNVYRPKMTIKGMVEQAKSKGYLKLGEDDLPPLGNMDWNDPYIQDAMKQGYIGIKHNDAYTNWLTGTSKDFSLKKVPQLLPQLRNPYAMGGLVKPKYFNAGGMVKKYAKGGDVVPSMLTPGEFVMSKYAVKNYGADTMKAMNSGTLNEGSVYNYSVNVSVQSNANPDQIARAVITQIRQIDSQRIRSSNF